MGGHTKSDDATKQPRAHSREVILYTGCQSKGQMGCNYSYLRLESEQGEAKEDAECDEAVERSKYMCITKAKLYAQCLQYDDVVKERNRHTQSERFHKSECGQKYEIPGMAVALPIQQAKVDESPKEGNIERPDTVQNSETSSFAEISCTY